MNSESFYSEYDYGSLMDWLNEWSIYDTYYNDYWNKKDEDYYEILDRMKWEMKDIREDFQKYPSLSHTNTWSKAYYLGYVHGVTSFASLKPLQHTIIRDIIDGHFNEISFLEARAQGRERYEDAEFEF